MKHLILSSVLAAAVSVAAAEEKKKSTSSSRTTSGVRYIDLKDKQPGSRNESTSTRTQFITQDGKTDGTVTVTISKDGKTEVKTWKIGDKPVGDAISFQPRRLEVRPTGKMEKVTWLGVAVTEISEDLASQLPLPDGVGLRVRQVIGDSPAAKAGLRANDLISQLDQQLIFNVHQFQALTRTYDAGEEVDVTYYRKGKMHTATAKLAKKEMLMNSAHSFPNIQMRSYPDANKAWTSVLEHRAQAEAQRKQAIDAANQARDAAKMQSWVRSSPAPKRAVIVRPDGKSMIVRTEKQIRSDIRSQVLRSLKDAGVSEKVMKDTLRAFDKGFEGYPKN
ncbi:MAG: S1C family serine protease [Limisphaerales bacterium]